MNDMASTARLPISREILTLSASSGSALSFSRSSLVLSSQKFEKLSSAPAQPKTLRISSDGSLSGNWALMIARS